MTELPAPTAQGDLARTPFAHALLYCHQRALTGTLVVWPEDPSAGGGQDRVRFERGVVVAARLTQKAGALDRGLLPLFARAAGPYAFYADVDLVGAGDAVRTGRVDPVVLLAASLRGRSRDDVVQSVLAAFGDAPVRMKPGVDLRPLELLPKELSFVEVIRAAPAPVRELAAQCELGETAGRRLLYLFAVTKSLEPWTAAGAASAPAASPRSIAPGPAAQRPQPPQIATSPAPRATTGSQRPAALVEEEVTFTPLSATDAAPAAPASATRASLPPAGVPSGAAASRARKLLELELPPPPAPSLSAEHRALWEEVTRTLRTIDHQSYFEMLGIPREAGAEAARKAYFGLVKKWHPDRVPAELTTLKPFVERIFHQLTAAQDTLCDEKKRGNYMRVLSDGGGTPESDRKMTAVLQAAMDHQKAEVLIKRRDHAGAIELLRGAIVLSPDDADAHATLAWALFQAEPGPERIPEMLASADAALAINPNNDRAHFYRAMILRRAGREAEALVSFEKAATLNPKNLDAVREVRIARMRGAGVQVPASPKSIPPKPTQSGGGLLSRLFGKKE